MLFALALDQVLKAGGDERQAYEIVEAMKQMGPFEGASGPVLLGEWGCAASG